MKSNKNKRPLWLLLCSGVLLLVVGAFIFRAQLSAEAVNNYDEANVLLNTKSKPEDFQKALLLLDKTIELAPEYVDAHIGRSYALSQLHRYDEAVKAASRAIELDSNNITARLNRATDLTSLKQEKRALRDIEFVLAIEPEKATTWQGKGYAH